MHASGNTILVTGGGTGIGRALAQRWHDRGNRVIITGRRLETLVEAARGRERISVYSLDVDDPAGVRAFAGRVLAEHPDLNVLVNNAGIYSDEDPTSSRDLTSAERMVTTNLLGPIRMTDALIDHLKGRLGAAVINVSSGTGFVPYPASPTYGATKAAIHSYTVALRPLLKGRVEVIEIIPTQVQTELSPGQSQLAHCMPLDEYADEVMQLLDAGPASGEICVERVRAFRFAEAEGRFDEVLASMVAYL